MLRWFERRTRPFPTLTHEQPPKRLLAFCLHYAQGFKRFVAVLTVTSALQGALEVMLFAFMGDIVNWLGSHNRATFLHDEADTLWRMGFVVLVALPLLTLINSLVRHQTLMGNFPMAIRWRMHRSLLEQSMAFYQNEFAGRVATKVMQTALAVRQMVLKAADLFVYIGLSLIHI